MATINNANQKSDNLNLFQLSTVNAFLPHANVSINKCKSIKNR